MKFSQLKLGEKVLFGITGLIIVFAVVSFIMLEIYRSHLDHPMYPATAQFDFSAEGQKGSELFRDRGCTDCHRALRNGTNHGVNLDGIGSKRSLDYLLRFLKKPEATYETKTLAHSPTKDAAYVARLTDVELHAIAVFLSQLKAIQGSPDARLPTAERSSFVDEMVKIWAPDKWKSGGRDIREEAAKPQ